MKNLLIITALTLPIGIFAQGPNTNVQINPPAQSQMQNINYYDQIDGNNNSLGNASNKINDDINPIQTNIMIQQQANPPAQIEQQSSGSIFGSEENNQTKKPYCKDCDAVHKALAAAHSSSGANHHKKSFSMKRWSKKISGRTSMKMKKMFAHKYKPKTSYAVCFNWH